MTDSNFTFKELYQGFSLPLSEIDCGEKCGPFNNYGVPVCCDIELVVPSAYDREWEYLQTETELWHLWQGSGSLEQEELIQSIQPGQKLIQCLGHQSCQRSYRSITCRAFPFYPYLDSSGKLLGLAYYREFRDQCWIISNLSVVSTEYKEQFQRTFEKIFQRYSDTKENFLHFSGYMREQVADAGESMIFLDFAGRVFMVNPISEETREISYRDLKNYGPFGIIKELVFPDEVQDQVQAKKN
ncbi:MAG: hypothetical protein K8R16_01665 [Anaerolineales bacterium]|nr:hypothetical protein [Anaerolineales bacterium]